MDNIPEREQPKREREISIGEEFQPFDPKRVYRFRRVGSVWGVDHVDSHPIVLRMENLKIPFRASAYPARGMKLDSVTPFDRDVGYQIDSDDLTAESRISKIKRLRKELYKNIDFSKAPLNFSIGVYRNDFINLPQETQEALLNAEDEEYNLLRLLLFFPNGRYISTRPHVDEYKTRGGKLSLSLNYFNFYPIDSRPLAVVPVEPLLPTEDINLDLPDSLEEGLSIFLPSDPEKLSQIRAKFVMVEEQPQE